MVEWSNSLGHFKSRLKTILPPKPSPYPALGSNLPPLTQLTDLRAGRHLLCSLVQHASRLPARFSFFVMFDLPCFIVLRIFVKSLNQRVANRYIYTQQIWRFFMAAILVIESLPFPHISPRWLNSYLAPPPPVYLGQFAGSYHGPTRYFWRVVNKS